MNHAAPGDIARMGARLREMLQEDFVDTVMTTARWQMKKSPGRLMWQFYASPRNLKFDKVKCRFAAFNATSPSGRVGWGFNPWRSHRDVRGVARLNTAG